MAQNANKEILERALEDIWNLGKAELLERYYHEDYVAHFNPPIDPPLRLEGLRQDLLALREAFPDFHEEVHALIVQDDTVVARITLSGTQSKPYLQHPSHGRRFEVATIDIYRFADGKIVEQWGVMDSETMNAQLGWTNA